jgi:hypothetical protein
MINFRSNITLVFLFNEIIQIRNISNKTEILREAIVYAAQKSANWKAVSVYRIKDYKGATVTTPLLHFSVDDELFSDISEQITEALKLTKTARDSLVVKLLLVNYYLFLNDDKNSIKETRLAEFSKLGIDEKLSALYNILLEIEMNKL